MATALISHADCLKHETPYGHPERVARLETIMSRLDDPAFSDLARVEAPECAVEHILRVHPKSYFDKISAASPLGGTVNLDPDTHMSTGSFRAAMRAAGAGVKAVDLVLNGEFKNAFCATRPPGHHAETARSMGFCLFGNVAIAAKYALDSAGLERVAVVDFDVHHGNGTSDLLWSESRALFASTHQMPLYPGSGHKSETGKHGQIINAPLAPGSGGREFRRAMEVKILPRIEAHDPELVLISAGFDAHRRDPLANLEFDESDFAWATGALCDVAEKTCGGKIVSFLEGGYDLQALADSVAAHIEVLMGR